MYVKPLSSSSFRKIIPVASQAIESLANDSRSLIIAGREITSSLVQKYIHSNTDDIHERLVKPILIDAAVRSESIAAGSGDICLKMISLMISDGMRSKLDIDITDISNEIKNKSYRACKEDIEKLININSSTKIQRIMMNFIFDNISSNTPVFVEKTNSISSSIRLTAGFNFEMAIDKKYIKNNWSHNSVRCFVIDGFIESVSEIHHLLEKAAEDKQPYVIFARHISEEVNSTLLYNNSRGTINVIPICVGFDETTLNILNDISICTGAELVSSLKGDLISASVKRDPTVVKKISISNGRINIVGDDTQKLRSHLRYLNEKKLSSESVQLVEIFEKRIKSLSAGNAEIKIGQDLLSRDPNVVEKIDTILRNIKPLIQTGVTYKKHLNNISHYIDMSLDDNHPYSPLSLIIALKSAYSACNSLLSVGFAIYEE